MKICSDNLDCINFRLISHFLAKCANSSFVLQLFKNNRIPTHLSFKEKIALSILASGCRGKLLEIGSYLGASACYIALTINRSSTSRLYCVDTWENDAMSEGQQKTYFRFLHNTAPYHDRIVTLRGTSAEIAQSFDKPLNFIFFDGDHSYTGIKEDVDIWLPKLESGGLVVFHDIGWAEGVQRVVREEIKPIAKAEQQLSNLYWAWI
jgi:predicted O-methyltransferase YrrM